MTESEKKLRKGIWPGEPVPREFMMSLLKEKFTRENMGGRIHYLLSSRRSVRPAETLFTVRICHCEFFEPAVKIYASFDGVPGIREMHRNDLMLCSSNASNSVVDISSCWGGLSIIFHMHHIRLNYCHFKDGKTLTNIYYHTPEPANGALLRMSQALDAVIHDSAGGTTRDARSLPLIEAIAAQLYCELEGSSRQVPRNPQSQRLKDYLDHNFHRPINCSTVCDDLGINRTYGSMIFHADFGITMMEYLLRLRLDAAKFLLNSQHDLKVEEIARFCAFQSSGYFIRVFRSRFGLTPGEFRDSAGNSAPK